MAALDQILTQEQAAQILNIVISQAEGIRASFPRISLGWVDFDTPAFQSLAEWYHQYGNPVQPFTDIHWAYDELIAKEQRLAGDDYTAIFQLEN
jgi:hypothetical protein